jgi:hypothetical protein
VEARLIFGNELAESQDKASTAEVGILDKSVEKQQVIPIPSFFTSGAARERHWCGS